MTAISDSSLYSINLLFQPSTRHALLLVLNFAYTVRRALDFILYPSILQSCGGRLETLSLQHT